MQKAVKLIIKIKNLYKGYQSMDKISKKAMKQLLMIAANMKSFRRVTKFWGDFHRKFVSKQMQQAFPKQFAQSRFPNDFQDSIDEEKDPKIAQHKKKIQKENKKAGMGGSGLAKLIPVKKIMTPIKKRLKMIKKLKKKMKIAIKMRKKIIWLYKVTQKLQRRSKPAIKFTKKVRDLVWTFWMDFMKIPRSHGGYVWPKSPPIINQTYVGAMFAGGWGGSCTCPNGQVYWVGDNWNGCKSMACVGGVSGKCQHKLGNWSFKKVVCGKED